MTGKINPLGTLTRGKAAIVLIVAFLIGPVIMLGLGQHTLMRVLAGLTETLAAVAVVVAAGGFGWMILAPLRKDDPPVGLSIVTAALVGLGTLSLAVMLVGTTVPAALTFWVWWPIILVGIFLALWKGHSHLDTQKFPREFDSRFMLWAVVAAAAGFWMVGVARGLPEWIYGTPEAREEIYRQLQMPSEFLSGGVRPLMHNAYSYGGLGREMLTLLAMVLRGGAVDGMHLARFFQGAVIALTVAAIFASFRTDDDRRARYAVAMLVTTPLVIMIGWFARADMVQLCCMTLAALWIRQWMRNDHWAAGALAGIMLGLAVTLDYSAIWLLAGPVLVAMSATVAIRHRGGSGVAAAAAMVLVVAAPWLIRTAACADGNPLFPYATEHLGAAHWSPQEQQRWVSAHSIPPGPPVPLPSDWKATTQPGRLAMLQKGVASYEALQVFGMATLPAVAIAVCLLVAAKRPDPWEWALVGMIGATMAAWILLTPLGRYVDFLPMIGCVCMLAASALSRLGAIERNPFRKKADPPPGTTWGATAAAGILFASVLFGGVIIYSFWTQRVAPRHTLVSHDLWSGMDQQAPGAAELLVPMPAGARVMMVGTRDLVFLPPDTIYASPFDDVLLADLLSENRPLSEVMAELKAAGVTHIIVCWYDVFKDAYARGYSDPLSEGLYQRFTQDRLPDLPVLRRMAELGMKRTGVHYSPWVRFRREQDAKARAKARKEEAERRKLIREGKKAPKPKPPLPKLPNYWPDFSIYELPWYRPASQPAPASAPTTTSAPGR